MMEPSNVRKKKKRTVECNKRTVTSDVETARCDDGTIKCEKKITRYSRLPTSGYRTLSFFWGGGV